MANVPPPIGFHPPNSLYFFNTSGKRLSFSSLSKALCTTSNSSFDRFSFSINTGFKRYSLILSGFNFNLSANSCVRPKLFNLSTVRFSFSSFSKASVSLLFIFLFSSSSRINCFTNWGFKTSSLIFSGVKFNFWISSSFIPIFFKISGVKVSLSNFSKTAFNSLLSSGVSFNSLINSGFANNSLILSGFRFNLFASSSFKPNSFNFSEVKLSFSTFSKIKLNAIFSFSFKIYSLISSGLIAISLILSGVKFNFLIKLGSTPNCSNFSEVKPNLLIFSRVKPNSRISPDFKPNLSPIASIFFK